MAVNIQPQMKTAALFVLLAFEAFWGINRFQVCLMLNSVGVILFVALDILSPLQGFQTGRS